MADGAVTLRNKSSHKGEIFDEFMAEVDFCSLHQNERPISNVTETPMFNASLNLRAYVLIEEKNRRLLEGSNHVRSNGGRKKYGIK
jgi:hypothetical protein